VVLPAGGTAAARAAGSTYSSAARGGAVLGAVSLVSCPSAGDCAAAGASLGSGQGFVVNQVRGRWGEGHLVTAGFGGGLPADISSLSCPSAGNCAAGGSAGDAAFVVSQVRGVWREPRQVAGNLPGQPHFITSLSCGTPGNCTAGGAVGVSDGTTQAFLVSERHGRWGAAFEVPGLARLDVGQNSTASLISCPSAGNCAASGVYTAHGVRGSAEPFLVIQRGGQWGRAFGVAGNLRARSIEIGSLSCAAAGDCVAAGYYIPANGHKRPFLVTESNGDRGSAFPVPGLAALSSRGVATLNTVSCASPGNCAGGGRYTDAAGNTQAFVVTERGGLWGRAMRLPGLAALDAGGLAEVTSVSCPAPGDCVAVGHFMARDTTTSSIERPFADSQRNGRWGQVVQIRGLPGGAAGGLQTVSCASASDCAAADEFLVDKVNGRWSTLFYVRVG
jgi:hypothetical protein